MDIDFIDGVICDVKNVTEPLKRAGYTVIENVLFHGRFLGSNGKPISGELRDTFLQLLELDYRRERKYVEFPLGHLEFHTRKPRKTLERHLPELVTCGLLSKVIRKNGKHNLPTRYIFEPFPVREIFRACSRIRYFHSLSAYNPPVDSDLFDRLFDDHWAEVGPALEQRFKPARLTMKRAQDVEQQLGLVERVEAAEVGLGQNIQLTPIAVEGSPLPTLDHQVAERIGQRVTIPLTNAVVKWQAILDDSVILAAVDHAVGGAGSKPVTLNWIDTILDDWHRQGVRTVAHARKVINDHREKRRSQRESKRKPQMAATTSGVRQEAKVRTGRFDRFVDR